MAARLTWVTLFAVVAALVATAAAAEVRRPRCPGAEVNLNLVDAELPEVLELLSKTTGRRFILGGDVRATKITLFSPTPVCSGEAYEAILGALAAQGLTIVRRGRFHLVVPVAEAVKGAIPVVVDP